MDVKAQKIIMAYAEDSEGLIYNACAESGFSDRQYRILFQFFHRSRGAPITEDKRGQLKNAGFRDEFINDIAGDDGLFAIRKRIHWLAKNSVRHWLWGSSFIDMQRGDMLDKLSRMGPAVREVIEEVYDSLDDRSCFVRTQAAKVVVGAGNEDAIPFLIDAIKSTRNIGYADCGLWRAEFGKEVVNAISRHGRKYLPALIENLKNDNSDVRLVMAEALGNIGDKQAVGGLTERLKDEDFSVRLRVAVALGKMEEIDALSVLMQIVRHEYYSIPDTSVLIAAGMNGLGPAGALSLIGVMENSDTSPVKFRSCQNAAWVFRYMDPSLAFWALPDLEDIAEKHPNASCRVQARQAADWILDKTP